ncbi:MAG: flagellar motor protein MotB [Deltaproteobacteria bacterium]|jgi:chemotaxis protein MotB|nr:flagellar motor protein MotB [Deltaproteobacteria bacterium]
MSGSWKVAYADFVTAMMAFFLLMWILAQVPEEKLSAIAGYFKEGGQLGASGTVVQDATSVPPTPDGSEQPLSENARSSIEISRFITDKLRQTNLQDSVRVTPSETGVLLRAQSGVLFAKNGVDINQNGDIILGIAAAAIKQFKVNLVVRGHADASESGNQYYRNQWEISAMRSAVATESLITRYQISPSMLASTFYGATRPIVPDQAGVVSPENRRVEFFFHRPEIAINISGGY